MSSSLSQILAQNEWTIQIPTQYDSLHVVREGCFWKPISYRANVVYVHFSAVLFCHKGARL